MQEAAKNHETKKDWMLTPYAFASLTARSNGMEVVYLAHSPQHIAQYADELRAFGFNVLICSSIAAVRSCLAASAAPLIVLQATPATVHLAVAQLRVAFCRASIVVITDFPDRLSRAGALLSGADACVDAAPDSLELIAALLASLRRLRVEGKHRKVENIFHKEADVDPGERATAYKAVCETNPQGEWSLENDGWILEAPNGARMELNHSERNIMLRFFSHPKEPLTRASQDALYNPEGGRVTRSLDVAISRLRKKAAAHAIRLPIRSIRGEGYVFAAGELLNNNDDAQA
ncbi:winged helix-turn-helix domain-containing protein [Pollutimonas sp. M17]|uniref:winged helix-turn-helix domain-containing protein n=1 Tax=Pollutimonas sp. M17 TaxID=2962065 RepID=UPI0021F3DDD3|nr:winged helix-turn-helix domain-containing protein [Pollutimonas sp. M17]UYO93360.1 winged helix-turn-helix domain-containing protein [Pollutimonas sp. M17]